MLCSKICVIAVGEGRRAVNLCSMKRRETSAAEYLRGGPAPVIVVTHFRDMAQSGSAPALGAGGRRFESYYPDKI